MSQSDSRASARWIIILALALLAPGLFLASGKWQASLALSGEADTVKNAFVHGKLTEPLTSQQLGDVLADTGLDVSVYEITTTAQGYQLIALEFSTTEGGRVFVGTRTYACYRYQLTFEHRLEVTMSRLRPIATGGRACTEITPVPLNYGEPLRVVAPEPTT